PRHTTTSTEWTWRRLPRLSVTGPWAGAPAQDGRDLDSRLRGNDDVRVIPGSASEARDPSGVSAARVATWVPACAGTTMSASSRSRWRDPAKPAVRGREL